MYFFLHFHHVSLRARTRFLPQISLFSWARAAKKAELVPRLWSIICPFCPFVSLVPRHATAPPSSLLSPYLIPFLYGVIVSRCVTRVPPSPCPGCGPRCLHRRPMLLSRPASSAECLCTWLCSLLPLFWALSVVRSGVCVIAFYTAVTRVGSLSSKSSNHTGSQ